MAIPYMGSKRKSAHKIYLTIAQRHPESKTLIDLFCGGFAISEEFYRNGWDVIANDKNKYVVALIRETLSGGFNDDNWDGEFVTRKKFNHVLANPDDYPDWYVGFVQCVWSFGNTQKNYIFGESVEPIKHAGHKLVVDKDPSAIRKLVPSIPEKFIEGILRQPDWHKRRIALVKVAKSMNKRVYELQQLQQLERLERLQQLERLELTSLDYDQVDIPKGAIVYCDPPYKGTAEYKEGGFNHVKFWQWVREKSKTNPVYVSEYNAPNDFKVIRSFSQKSTLQGGVQKHTNQPDEKIFVYNQLIA